MINKKYVQSPLENQEQKKVLLPPPNQHRKKTRQCVGIINIKKGKVKISVRCTEEVTGDSFLCRKCASTFSEYEKEKVKVNVGPKREQYI